MRVTRPTAPTGQGRVAVTAEDGTVRTYTVEVSATADGFLASTARTATSVVVTAAVSADGGTGAAAGSGSQVASAADGTTAATRLSTTGSAALPVLLVALARAGTGAVLLGTRLRARRTRSGEAL